MFYVRNFNTYDFNLDSQNNNHIFIIILRIILHFFNIHISHTVFYYFKNNCIIIVSTYQIRVVSDI